MPSLQSLDTSVSTFDTLSFESRQSAWLISLVWLRETYLAGLPRCPRCASTRTPIVIKPFLLFSLNRFYAGAALFAPAAAALASFVVIRIALFSSAMSRGRTKFQLARTLEGSYDRPIVGESPFRSCFAGCLGRCLRLSVFAFRWLAIR